MYTTQKASAAEDDGKTGFQQLIEMASVEGTGQFIGNRQGIQPLIGHLQLSRALLHFKRQPRVQCQLGGACLAFSAQFVRFQVFI